MSMTLKEKILAVQERHSYLCFRGPLIPLLFLATSVTAVLKELSVYKLKRVKGTDKGLKKQHEHSAHYLKE